MLKITKLGTVKVRSWSTLPQFSHVFRSEISCTFSSPFCSSAGWKKIIFTFGKFHHRTTFSFQNSRISCHEWCIFCLKGNHLRKKNPQGLNFKCMLLRQHGGESALSRLTRHSLLNTHRHKKRNTTVRNFSFHPARVKPADCTHDCQSTVSSFSHHQAPCIECSARFWRNLNCPCLFFPFGSHSRIIGSYWVKKKYCELLDVQISL